MLMVGVFGEIQTARQEELITELEEDLEAALSKLRIRDKELEVWKDRSRRLSEGSVVPASGIPSSCLTSCLQLPRTYSCNY